MSSDLFETLIPCKSTTLNATVLPDGRWLLYNQAERIAMTLNATAGILWELCDGTASVADLIDQLQQLYPEVDASYLHTETVSMLRTFLEQGLVVKSAAPNA